MSLVYGLMAIQSVWGWQGSTELCEVGSLPACITLSACDSLVLCEVCFEVKAAVVHQLCSV